MQHLIVELLADGIMLPIVVLALYALLWKVPRLNRYDCYTHILMAGATSYMLAKVIGSIWRPEQLRPFEQLGVNPGAMYLNNPGFPSDHALFGFFLTGAVWYGSHNRLLTGAMAVLTILMCIGRVLALVHTPLDIVGAFGIAMLGSVWYGQRRRKRRPHHLMAVRAKK